MEISPKTPEALVREARRLLAGADLECYEEAVSLLCEALFLEPDCAAAHASLAEAYAYWGFRREIAGLDGKDLQRMAHEHAEAALRLAPDRADAHRAMAVAVRRGDKADAARRMREAMAAVDLDSGDPQNWLEVWRAAGYDPENEAIARALELGPDLPAARIDLAAALVARGRLDEAAAQLLRVLQLAPRNALAHFDLAMVLQRKGEDAQARAVIARARSIHRDDALLASAAAQLGAAR
jgi:tetratricopeptide (TPR) repeat protein